MREFSRRDLMKAAAATVAVPLFLRQAFAQPSAARPRLFLLMQTNGTHQSDFWPGSTFNSPILRPLLAEPKLAGKTTVIKGLYNKTFSKGGTHHDDGFSGLYSGYRTIDAGGTPLGGGISIDQFLKQKLPLSAPYPTLHCGVFASYRPFNPNRFSFSYVARGQQVPCERDLVAIYAKLFGQVASQPGQMPAAARAEVQRRLEQRRSVLDVVATDLGELGRRLGAEERRKVDTHLTALRELEMRLGGSLTNGPGMTVGQCRPPAMPAAVAVDPKQEDAAIPRQFRLLLEMLAVAAVCNLVPIVTFQFGKGGEHFRYGWLDIDMDGHDDIAHRDSGENARISELAVKINVWHAEEVAFLARTLDSFQEGGGTALDQSLIVWGNELATGPHGREGIPVVLIGKAAGRLKKTGYLVDKGPQEYHRLGATILNIMGHETKGFGEEPDCGTLDGVEL